MLYHFSLTTLYGSVASHINLLCTFAEHKSPKHRRIALEILRNFAFNASNRSALLNSADFLRLSCAKLTDRDYAEQLLITVAIWKLIAQSTKAKNVIKNSLCYTKLRQLKETIGRILHSNRNVAVAMNGLDANGFSDSVQETIEDLSTALDCVLNLLQP